MVNEEEKRREKKGREEKRRAEKRREKYRECVTVNVKTVAHPSF